MSTWAGTIHIAGGPRTVGLRGEDFRSTGAIPGGASGAADGNWSWVGDVAVALLKGLLSGREGAASHATSQSFPRPATGAESDCCRRGGFAELGVASAPVSPHPNPSRAGAPTKGTGLRPAGASPPDARGVEDAEARPARPVTTPDTRPTFEAEVRGQAAREIDLELAAMAQDVYDLDSQGIDGWTRLDEEALEAAGIDSGMLEDPDSGFRASIYTDGEGRYVLAFAGTNDVRDWLHNVRQGLGFDSEQYEAALRLGRKAKAAFGDDLVVTGHSLGGGLASAVALDTGAAAVTFNAAGLHDDTIRALGYDPTAARAAAEGGLVRRYAVDGEAVTGAQEDGSLAGALADAVGHKIELEDPDSLSFWERLIPGNEEWFHPVQLHLMDAVLAALEADRPWGG